MQWYIRKNKMRSFVLKQNKFNYINHTFAICAYKESPYLEDCIKSVKAQTKKSYIIMVTSTPNDHISSLAEKYKIPLFVRDGASDIAQDWNFAYDKAKTELVTITHQDDIYLPEFCEKTVNRLNQAAKPLIAFTGYGERRHKANTYKDVYSNKLLNIKKFLLFPMLIKAFENSIFIRRRVLSFGSSICCPSVTYVKTNLPKHVFVSGYICDLDWQAWEMLSKRKGAFCYISKPLMLHRIHEQSTTSFMINGTGRKAEDFEMFCKFWPKPIAKFIEMFYKDSEKQNG